MLAQSGVNIPLFFWLTCVDVFVIQNIVKLDFNIVQIYMFKLCRVIENDLLVLLFLETGDKSF